jgi:hypothetical protein
VFASNCRRTGATCRGQALRISRKRPRQLKNREGFATWRPPCRTAIPAEPRAYSERADHCRGDHWNSGCHAIPNLVRFQLRSKGGEGKLNRVAIRSAEGGHFGEIGTDSRWQRRRPACRPVRSARGRRVPRRSPGRRPDTASSASSRRAHRLQRRRCDAGRCGRREHDFADAASDVDGDGVLNCWGLEVPTQNTFVATMLRWRRPVPVRRAAPPEVLTDIGVTGFDNHVGPSAVGKGTTVFWRLRFRRRASSGPGDSTPEPSHPPFRLEQPEPRTDASPSLCAPAERGAGRVKRRSAIDPARRGAPMKPRRSVPNASAASSPTGKPIAKSTIRFGQASLVPWARVRGSARRRSGPPRTDAPRAHSSLSEKGVAAPLECARAVSLCAPPARRRRPARRECSARCLGRRALETAAREGSRGDGYGSHSDRSGLSCAVWPSCLAGPRMSGRSTT